METDRKIGMIASEHTESGHDVVSDELDSKEIERAEFNDQTSSTGGTEEPMSKHIPLQEYLDTLGLETSLVYRIQVKLDLWDVDIPLDKLVWVSVLILGNEYSPLFRYYDSESDVIIQLELSTEADIQVCSNDELAALSFFHDLIEMQHAGFDEKSLDVRKGWTKNEVAVADDFANFKALTNND